jgi:extracellular factor (EF) 3-hydroxypalmitic acid methyl ester biosynthesis protein
MSSIIADNSIISGHDFLDVGAAKFEQGEEVAEIMAMISAELYHIRQNTSSESWKQFTSECRQHPIMQFLHQDPLTWRAFHKPRGYAGDAEMLDFVYAIKDGFALPALAGTSELGKQICHFMSDVAASRGVRARRRIIIEKLNVLAARKPGLQVLSLACGHLREAKRCSAFLEGRIGRYVAVDQDKESLAVVQREVGALGVETVNASVRDFLKGQVALTGFDFVYASGLYDYLSLPVAQSLSAILFEMLNPGGRLLVANFLPDISTAGYMEACMDWWLIYRTRIEMLQLADTLPDEQIEALHLYAEENQNILFLEAERKG